MLLKNVRTLSDLCNRFVFEHVGNCDLNLNACGFKRYVNDNPLTMNDTKKNITARTSALYSVPCRVCVGNNCQSRLLINRHKNAFHKGDSGLNDSTIERNTTEEELLVSLSQLAF